MAEYLAENSRLRLLSRQYSEGQVSFEEFRAARREIIEALEAGHVQAAAAPLQSEPRAEATAPFAQVPPVEESVFLKTMPPNVPVTEAVAAVAAPAPGWDAHTRVLAIVLGVAFVLALGALFYVFAL